MNQNTRRILLVVVAFIAIIVIFTTGYFFFRNRNNHPEDNNNEQSVEDGSLDSNNNNLSHNKNNSNITENSTNSPEESNPSVENNSSDIEDIEGGLKNGNGNDLDPELNKSPNPYEGGSNPDIIHIDKPDTVKALYLTGWTAGSKDRLDYFVELANNTEINSYVIDIKDDDGLVGYKSDLNAVNEVKGWLTKYNVDTAIKTFHDNGIYVIGRLVCFKDPVLSTKRVDFAIKNTSGGLWRDNNNQTWLDPYNRESWPYIIDIAKEAVQKGFDEIQFDYIRFPSDGNKKAMVFNSGGIEKYELINEFISYTKKELPHVPLSIDVFGIICESPKDTEDIGQYLELVGMEADFISPMVYPSHYAIGQVVNNVRFDKPDLEPYAVVYNSLLKAKNRLSEVEDYKAGMRPYLQGFTASYLRAGNYQTYGAKQIREQINAVYDAGYKDWIIWDPSNKYPVDAFEE